MRSSFEKINGELTGINGAPSETETEFNETIVDILNEEPTAETEKKLIMISKYQIGLD